MLHDIATWTFAIVLLIYLTTSMLLFEKRHLRHSRWNTVWKYSKWLSVVLWVVTIATRIHDGEPVTPISVLADCTAVIAWYLNRDSGDDDTQNKLKKKSTEIVRVLEGRLVVVPRGA